MLCRYARRDPRSAAKNTQILTAVPDAFQMKYFIWNKNNHVFSKRYAVSTRAVPDAPDVLQISQTLYTHTTHAAVCVTHVCYIHFHLEHLEHLEQTVVE
jgi:hypothetical protein